MDLQTLNIIHIAATMIRSKSDGVRWCTAMCCDVMKSVLRFLEALRMYNFTLCF